MQEHGAGAYRVSGLNALPLANLNQAFTFAGWWMVVFYARDSEPARNLALFDGLDFPFDGAPATSTIAGFIVPSTAYDDQARGHRL